MKKSLNFKNLHALKIPIHIYISFATTTFLGAFLLFQVQPIISKYILPSFGGTSAVWITAMLFFQTLLLVGYFYVFLISILSVKKQIILHSFLLISVAFGIFALLQSYQIPVLPDINLKLFYIKSPILQVLEILFIATGLTYFMLSTTSILLQKWLGVIFAKSPYILYSLSNIASLLALISYPFLVEPFFQLKTQGYAWSVGYLIYSLFLLFCCFQVFHSLLKIEKNNQAQKISDTGDKKIEKRKFFLWILFPAISSLMLLATTNLLTQSVAPVPFLLLMPLTIYMISFILCFSGKSWYKPNLYASLFLITCFLSLVFHLLLYQVL